MTTTYHPATNRYAAIVEAVRTPPPLQPRLHLARISLSVPPMGAAPPMPPQTTEEGDTPSATPAPRPTVAPDERAVKRAAILDDYTDALPTVRTRAEHGMLTTRLARKHGVAYPFVKTVTADWREAHGYRVPTYSANGDALRPGEVDLLQVLAASPDVVSGEQIAAELGRDSAKAVGALVATTRARLVLLTEDSAAADVIVTSRQPRGYRLDTERARRYPVIVAALEGVAL